GAHPLLDLVGPPRGREVRGGDAAGEQRGEDATGDAGLVERLADDQGVADVAAPAADLLGEGDAEQPEVPGLAVELAGQQAVGLPPVLVGQDLDRESTRLNSS